MDIDSFFIHNRENHFVCFHQDCLNNKIQVFENDYDLLIHTKNEHKTNTIANTIPLNNLKKKFTDISNQIMSEKINKKKPLYQFNNYDINYLIYLEILSQNYQRS